MQKGPADYAEKVLDDLVLSEFHRVEKTLRRQPAARENNRAESGDPEHGGDADGPEEATGIPDEEEEKFVRTAVEWLRPRVNKDAIVSRIWSMLTESEPEKFYSPESGASGQPGPSGPPPEETGTDAGQERQD
jgi:hypothetical protein